MGNFTNEQIEVISVSALNMLLCNYKEIDPKINWNDKEPSWDGNVYLYEDDSHKKSILKGRIPVQVKGTEVKRFGRKFASFPMGYSDIKNYYYDGGVLFFVIQIISNTEFRVFYKFLLPIDLKKLMEEITEKGQKSKSVHIDSILNNKSKFTKECEEFLIHRQRQSINTVERSVTLESIKDKSIEFIGDSNPFNMINKDVYFYTRDEFGIHIPIKNKVTFKAISYSMSRDLKIGDRLYFDKLKILKDENGEVQLIGDGLEHNLSNGTITLKETTKDIVTRFNTLDFLENGIDPKKKDKLKKELSVIKEQKNFISRIIKVCEKFKISPNNIKLSQMTKNDYEVLSILENVKTFSEIIDKQEHLCNICMERVDFFNNKILLISLGNEKDKYYVNYFEDEEKFDLVGSFEGKRVALGRFSILRDRDLLTCNFDLEIVKKSISEVLKRCKEDEKDILSSQYTLLALEAIKAWDISSNDNYIDLAKYIFNQFESYIGDNIITINKAQIEKRVSSKLSEQTKENLYRVKFTKCKEDMDYNEIIAAIDILLENEESFKTHFNKVSNKKFFMDYPIYTLYSKINK